MAYVETNKPNQMHPGKSDCVKESPENSNSGILARFQLEP